MKIGLSLPQRQICFQSGEANHKFDEYLAKAKTNESDAWFLLSRVDEDMITFAEERLKQVQQALEEAKRLSAKFHLKKIVEIWQNYLKP